MILFLANSKLHISNGIELKRAWQKKASSCIDCNLTECLAVVIVSTELYLRNEFFFSLHVRRVK